MKIRNVVAACALLLSGALTATQASAQFFVGGSVGQSDMDDEITNGLITSGTVDGKDTAWKIFGGYMFNRPDVVYHDVAGQEYRNRWKADSILLSVGAVYSLF